MAHKHKKTHTHTHTHTSLLPLWGQCVVDLFHCCALQIYREYCEESWYGVCVCVCVCECESDRDNINLFCSNTVIRTLNPGYYCKTKQRKPNKQGVCMGVCVCTRVCLCVVEL